MNIPIEMQIERVRGEIITAIQKIQSLYNFPPCIVEGILTSIIADIRNEEKIILINAVNSILKEKENISNKQDEHKK